MVLNVVQNAYGPAESYYSAHFPLLSVRATVTATATVTTTTTAADATTTYDTCTTIKAYVN
jgi:hypothetical protein